MCFQNSFDPAHGGGGVMGKKTTGNALLFRDLLNAEGIRSKALTVCSGAWGGNQYLDCKAGVQIFHLNENETIKGVTVY